MKYNKKKFALDLFLYISYSILSFQILSTQTLDFINSDSLYLATLERFGIFGVSPPPSTYYFPDYFLYYLTKAVLSDPFERIIAAGFVQLFLLVILFRIFSNFLRNFIFIFILLAFAPSLSITISFHLLSIALFFIILSAPKKTKNILLVAFGLMDPIVLLAWSIFLFVRTLKRNEYELRQQAALLISWLLCYVNGDLHPAHNKMLVMLALALLVTNLAHHLRLHERLKRYFELVTEAEAFRIIMCIFITAMLIVNQPDRYVIPLLGMALLNTTNKQDIEKQISTDLLLRLLPLIAVFFAFIFSFKALTSKLDQYLNKYDCLINSLNQDHIKSVATDYWLSKFILIRSNYNIWVMPFHFEKGKPYIWISPYRMASQEISFFLVRNDCHIGGIHCDLNWLNSFAKREKHLCEDYFLFKTAEPLLFDSVSSKVENIRQNFLMHVWKFTH